MQSHLQSVQWESEFTFLEKLQVTTGRECRSQSPNDKYTIVNVYLLLNDQIYKELSKDNAVHVHA